MNMAGLSLDQAPPFWSVARFFVTASIFGALFGVALVVMPSETIFERFSPSTIAVVHLYTIGFFAMTIFGSLMQMLPVLAGVGTPKAVIVALISYCALCIGALAFFAGFYFDSGVMKKIAVVSLSVATLSYFLPMIYAIFRASYVNFTIWGMRLAMLFAVIAFCLGLHLLSSYAFGSVKASQLIFADIHIALTSFGFVTILIVAVAHQVLPMFYVAPHFPDFCKKFIVLFAGSLVLYFGLKVASVDIADDILKAMTALVLSTFATVALGKISERRRKISDASLKLWQIGLVSLILSSVFFAMDIFWSIPHKEYIFATVFGFGFFTSIMKAMLNKIVPFLVWFHLTSEGSFDAPNINELLPQERALIEVYLHIGVFAFLTIGYFFAPLIKLAGTLMIIDFLLLASNLYIAASAYKRLSKRSI
jgi:hypothetical protein